MSTEREDPTEKIERPSKGDVVGLLVLHLLLSPDGMLVVLMLFTFVQQVRRGIQRFALRLFEENIAGTGFVLCATLLGVIVALIYRKRR